MLSYGLKPYNQEDCEEALEISRSLKGIDNKMDVILIIFQLISITPCPGASIPDKQSAGGSGSRKK